MEQEMIFEDDEDMTEEEWEEYRDYLYCLIDGDDLIQAMTEALAHAKGEGPAIVHDRIAPLEVQIERQSADIERLKAIVTTQGEAMAEAPLPCPFCGGDDMIILNGPVEDDWCAVSCEKCHARGPTDYTDPHAIAAWNRRAIPARGVGVRKLEWEQISDRTIEAAGVGSTYRIQTAQDGSVRWQSRYMGEWHNAPSIDAAKDAVNMFHEDALSQFVALAPITEASQ